MELGSSPTTCLRPKCGGIDLLKDGKPLTARLGRGCYELIDLACDVVFRTVDDFAAGLAFDDAADEVVEVGGLLKRTRRSELNRRRDLEDMLFTRHKDVDAEVPLGQ